VCVGMCVFFQNQLPKSFLSVHKRRHAFDGKRISHNNSATGRQFRRVFSIYSHFPTLSQLEEHRPSYRGINSSKFIYTVLGVVPVRGVQSQLAWYIFAMGHASEYCSDLPPSFHHCPSLRSTIPVTKVYMPANSCILFRASPS
jgi:hypothetical protein